MQEKLFVINTVTILKVFAIILAVVVLFLVRHIVFIFFAALLLSALIDPFANWLEHRKIHRGVAVLLVYAVLLSILVLALSLLVPIVKRDLPGLINAINSTVVSISNQPWFNTASSLFNPIDADQITANETVNTFSQMTTNFSSGLFTTVSGFFTGVVSVILVLVITFYLVSQDDPLRRLLINVLPEEYMPYTISLFQRIRDKLSLWIRGQLILSGIIGVAVFIGLSLFGIKYAAVLALCAAIFEFVPYVGPTLAATPAIALAFTSGGIVLGLSIVTMYVVIQQIQNHILVPKVMQKMVGLNPIASILAILVGAKLIGVLGVFLAIPVATVCSVIIGDILQYRKKNKLESVNMVG